MSLNPLTTWDSPRVFQNDDGSVVYATPKLVLGPGLVIRREPANAQPGEVVYTVLAADTPRLTYRELTIEYSDLTTLDPGVMEYYVEAANFEEGSILMGFEAKASANFVGESEAGATFSLGFASDPGSILFSQTIGVGSPKATGDWAAGNYFGLELPTDDKLRLTIMALVDLNTFYAGAIRARLFYGKGSLA